MKNFSSLPQALQALKTGKMIIVMDDPNRENQGDLIFPAATVTPDKINLMMQEARGLICVPITQKKAAQLHLPLMVAPADNTETTGLNFTVSVDSKTVTSFGISAGDKVKTIKTLNLPSSRPEQLVRPGHVFPIIAAREGLSVREGHTEATITLCQLSGFPPVGVLCEILNEKGETAGTGELFHFAQKFDLPIITIDQIKKYRRTSSLPSDNSFFLIKTAQAQLPTKYGEFTISVFKSLLDGYEHAVLTLGDLTKQPVLTRIHSQCLTGDTFSSLKCDCQNQLVESMKIIGNNRHGLILYLNQEGRGIGLSNKIAAYALQDKGLDTVEANIGLGLTQDARDYRIAAEILKMLKIARITLLTNNPDKVKQLEKSGIKVTPRSLEIKPNLYNKNYLSVKKAKLGHRLKYV